MKDLLTKLQKLTDKTPNSTHYFNYSRKGGCWVFRFQQIGVKKNGYYETAYFKGEEPEAVLIEAVKCLEKYGKERGREIKTNTVIVGVETNTKQ